MKTVYIVFFPRDPVGGAIPEEFYTGRIVECFVKTGDQDCIHRVVAENPGDALNIASVEHLKCTCMESDCALSEVLKEFEDIK